MNTVGPITTESVWKKTIGTNKDYSTFQQAIVEIPDIIIKNIIFTLASGTTLTESFNIFAKHSNENISFVLNSEKYYPTVGDIPQADAGGDTFLQDSSAFTVDGYFNGCWVLIVGGTGTDNGFVEIIDTNSSTGKIIVNGWQTVPDSTSRYIIVGSLIDAEDLCYGLNIVGTTISIYIYGIGIKNAKYNLICKDNKYVDIKYCGVFNGLYSGITFDGNDESYCYYSGIIFNNKNNLEDQAGVVFKNDTIGQIEKCGLENNGKQGILITNKSNTDVINNFGINNGNYGTVLVLSSTVGSVTQIIGTECSGILGNKYFKQS